LNILWIRSPRSWPSILQTFLHSPNLQARLDELGEKANEGTLTDAERSEYETFVEGMDVIAMLRVKSQASRNGSSDC
jgi:hypothetical protein